MFPLNDVYTYKVDGNKIFFKRTPSAPQELDKEFVEEIIKLDEKELQIKINNKILKYKMR